MAVVTLRALKIVPQTYNVYQQEPNLVHLTLPTVNNLFFVFDPELPRGHGWFSELDFRKNYRFVGDVSKTSFTEIARVVNTEDN